MRKFFQHYMNSTHIFCRLRDLGFSLKAARKYAIVYEKHFHKLIYV